MRCATTELRTAWLRRLALTLCLAAGACTQPAENSADETGIRLLAAAPEGINFARATEPREFQFPRDHGAHEDFATEWWYFTGNLRTDAGRHFGFELTFFRYALSATAAPRASAWAANQVWLAHFAITDTMKRKLHADERLGRGVEGIAGARDDRLDLYVNGWSARWSGEARAILLSATTEFADLELELTEAAPITPHGDNGLDRKGSEPGNASYYYSIPRLDASGTITVPDEPALEVRGTAWLDREWATSSLDAGVEGWDWFGLQLDDGTDLMLYRLRNSAGSTTPFSTGTIIRADGSMATIDHESVEYRIARRWRSPVTGVTYPVAWNISIPQHQLELEIAPAIDDQEIRLGLRYWEGAVIVRGHASARQITGVGYLELAGYR